MDKRLDFSRVDTVCSTSELIQVCHAADSNPKARQCKFQGNITKRQNAQNSARTASDFYTLPEHSLIVPPCATPFRSTSLLKELGVNAPETQMRSTVR